MRENEALPIYKVRRFCFITKIYFLVIFCICYFIQIISRLVDGSKFHEFKEMFGPTLVTGFAAIKG